MQEKYYGLLREYLVTLRERDLCEEQARKAPEEIERQQASLRLEMNRKRCAALRREIRRFPEMGTFPHMGASNNPTQRYRAQAS